MNPLQLALQGLLPLGLALLLLLQAVLLLLEPGGVVAFPRDADAVIEFQNPAGDVVQEVAVVGDGDHRARILLEMVLQPRHGLGVQVVGRLVEQQDVGLLQQEPAQGHAPLLAAGENADQRIARRAAQGVHRHFQTRVDIPGVQMIDLLLQLALPLQELVHLVVRHRLGELVADLVVLLHEIDHRPASPLPRPS